MGRTAEVLAPAKVNLHLSIGALRPDGYHDVRTVLQALELGDTLTITEADTLSLTCDPDLGVPAEGNLAFRAAEAFAAACGRAPAVALSLSKAVPAGAGLGGGSSDAAAVILAMAHLWDVRADDPRLDGVAATLGSDVPFFLGACAALMGGRGDVVERRIAAPAFDAVVVWPGVALSTAAAYAAYDAGPTAAYRSPGALVAALEAGDWRGAASLLHNDLVDASTSLLPVIGDALALVDGGEGVLGSCMCGSGSAVFGVCESGKTAREVAAAARSKGWWTAATRTVGGAGAADWAARRGPRVVDGG